MNNTTKFLTQIRPLINAKGVERAGGMPANSLGDFYSKLDAGKNPGLSEAALAGLVRALSPVFICGTTFQEVNGRVCWSRIVREYEEPSEIDGIGAVSVFEQMGWLLPGEISNFINGLEWPEETIY